MTATREQQNARAGNLYHSFMCGAHHAAGGKPLDPLFTEHTDPEIRKAYDEGWKAGRDAMANVSGLASALYGYKPTILRTQTHTGRWPSESDSGDSEKDLRSPAAFLEALERR